MRELATQAARDATTDVKSNDVWLVLLTMTSSASGAVFRVVNNNENITSNGNLFTAYAFDIVLPDDSLESDPQIQLTIDNVDRLLVDFLRNATAPPVFKIQIILARTPDTIEIELNELVLRNVAWNVSKITGTLRLDDIWNTKFPSVGETYDPQQFPGLF